MRSISVCIWLYQQKLYVPRERFYRVSDEGHTQFASLLSLTPSLFPEANRSLYFQKITKASEVKFMYISLFLTLSEIVFIHTIDMQFSHYK